ncbi:MAG: tetratricopeptide repeat protein [Rhodospirillales bacterium]
MSGAAPDALLARAADLHGKGRLAAAETLYRQVLTAAPGNPNALNLLGVLHIQRGDAGTAVGLIEKALRRAPKFPQAHHNLGWALQRLGRLKEAERHYRRAVALDPRLAESHNNLGNVLLARGRHKEARSAFERAVTVRPGYAEALSNLGDLLRLDGDCAGALAALDRAVAADPAHAAAEINRGTVLLALDRPGEAEAAFVRATVLAPGSAAAWNGLGAALDQLGRTDAAIVACEKALAIDPDHIAAHVNLGVSHRARGERLKAAEHYRRALALEPDNAAGHANLGNILADCGLWEEAADAYERSLAVAPENLDVLRNLGFAARRARDWDRGLAAARRLLAAEPDSAAAQAAQAVCRLNLADWTDSDATRRLLASVDAQLDRGEAPGIDPFTWFHLVDDPARNLRLAAGAARHIAGAIPAGRAPFGFAGRSVAGRRLRVGYVSGNYRNHATAHHLGAALAHHDRNRFEVIAYSHGPDDGSLYRRRIEETVDRFVDIAAETEEASADRIHADAVDILVDLMGHTADNRLRIFALRPAPISVAAMAFPGSSGATFIDYMIADRVVVPTADEASYSERVVRLPNNYNVNDRAGEHDVPSSSRDAHGLPQDAVVLCSFNQPLKVEPVMFDAWMRILAQAPQAVLWLMGRDGVARNLRREAAARAIAPDRLIVAPPIEKAAHLARLALADLMLDTRIVNGHVTTYDALWMGVPVVTLAGRHLPGRVSASALNLVGLPELVTHSLDEYEALALRLIGDAAVRGALRDRLAHARASSPLFDSARWIAGLERAYLAMWNRYCAGLPPASLDVSP